MSHHGHLDARTLHGRLTHPVTAVEKAAAEVLAQQAARR